MKSGSRDGVAGVSTSLCLGAMRPRLVGSARGQAEQRAAFSQVQEVATGQFVACAACQLRPGVF